MDTTTPTRTYPYKAWTLLPSFKPVEVELVKPTYEHSSTFQHWDESTTGRDYDSTKLHPEKEAAIAAGYAALDERRKKLEKMQTQIDKQHAALRKAEAA